LLGYAPVVSLEDGLRSLMGVDVSSDKSSGKSRR